MIGALGSALVRFTTSEISTPAFGTEFQRNGTMVYGVAQHMHQRTIQLFGDRTLNARVVPLQGELALRKIPNHSCHHRSS